MPPPENFDNLAAEEATAGPGRVAELSPQTSASSRLSRKDLPEVVLLLTLYGFTFGVASVLPILLSDLTAQHRFEIANIGTAFMCVGIAQGFSSLVFGMKTKMRRNRTTLFCSCIAVAVILFGMRFLSGNALLVACAIAGLPLGVMLSVATAGLISFGEDAVRLQGFIVLLMNVMQLALTLTLSGWIIPYFAAAGGFTFVSLLYLAAAFLFLAFFADSYRLRPAEEAAPRVGLGLIGSIALAAALLIFASKGAIFPYVIEVAKDIGLTGTAAGQSLSVFIGGQIAGAVVISIFAFGGRYLAVLTTALVMILATSFLCMLGLSTAVFYVVLFILAFALTVKDVFVLPMLMNLDPSLGAARQFGTASLFGETLIGPLASSAALLSIGVRGSLFATGGLLLLGMLIVYGLEFRARSARLA